MRDEEFRMQNQTWCYYHHQYEDAEPCFKQCLECGHVFPTSESLMQADLETTREHYKAEREDELPPSLLTLHACPYCLHDW